MLRCVLLSSDMRQLVNAHFWNVFLSVEKKELPWGFPDKPKGNLLFTSHLISFVLSLMELSDLPASPPPSRKQLTKLTPQQGQLGPNQKKVGPAGEGCTL